MSRRTNYSLIGAFVIGAIALLCAVVIVVGKGAFTTKYDDYVLFFPGSVKGLSPGAAVLFRGARIGSVKEIKVVYYQDSETLSIPVIIELSRSAVTRSKAPESGDEDSLPRDPFAKAEALIERGLRARLIMESFVTGQLNVSLDFMPDRPLRLMGLYPSLPEIPTLPSPFEQFSRTIENIPVDQLIKNVESLVLAATRLLESPELGQLFKSTNASVEELTTLLRKISENLGPLHNEALDLMSRGDKFMVEASKTMTNVNQSIQPGAPLNQNLNQTLRDVSLAARSIAQLADYLQRHPDAIVLGKRERNQ